MKEQRPAKKKLNANWGFRADNKVRITQQPHRGSSE